MQLVLLQDINSFIYFQKIQSSDEDLPKEEEAEVLRIQREKAKSLSMEDFGLEDPEQDESDTDAEDKTTQVMEIPFSC